MSDQHDSIRARTSFRHVCAWCRAALGTSQGPWTGEPVVTTHGVCGSCLLEARLRVGAPSPRAEGRIAAS